GSFVASRQPRSQSPPACVARPDFLQPLPRSRDGAVHARTSAARTFYTPSDSCSVSRRGAGNGGVFLLRGGKTQHPPQPKHGPRRPNTFQPSSRRQVDTPKLNGEESGPHERSRRRSPEVQRR